MECQSPIAPTFWIAPWNKSVLQPLLDPQAGIVSSLSSHRGKIHMLGTPWAPLR